MDLAVVCLLLVAALIFPAHTLSVISDAPNPRLKIYAKNKRNFQDMTLTLDRQIIFHESSIDPCGQVACQAKGNHVTVTRVTVTTIKADEKPTELLAVTTNRSENEIRTDNIHGNGTLNNNEAKIYLDLKDVSACDSEYFICEVTYTKPSGEEQTDFTMAGPGKFQNLESPSEPDEKTPERVAMSKSSSYSSGDPYRSELWFLGDKITKIEGKFETLRDRLDRKTTQNIDAVHKRASVLENSVLERVTSVETDFSTRVSRLEDRVSSLLLPESRDASSPSGQSLSDLARRVDEVSSSLEVLNMSRGIPQSEGHKEPKPDTCDRGMGDDVIKTYPPYAIMPHHLIGKNILCDTHTVGGGWIVIQRRAKGDVDFYRDWTAYRDGFGSPTGDFWMGNEAIHKLTDAHPYELRIEIRVKGQEMFSQYSTFRLEDESDKYRLRLGSHSGNAAHTAMAYHNNVHFSTFDRDYDGNSGSCANSNHGAWWYNNCLHSNLNGMWGVEADHGLRWYTGSATLYASFTEMKIRRVKLTTDA